MIAQGRALLAKGAQAVLMKGGHGEGETALDILCTPERTVCIELPRVDTPNTHGTGCTLSAAIAALMSRGASLEAAVQDAKTYVWEALQAGRTLGVGRGHGPVDHLYRNRNN